MPGEEINTTLRFDADITDYNAAMQEARRAASLANSEFNAVASTMDDWSSSTEGLTAKLTQLSAKQQVEERRLAVLRTAYEQVVKEQGENSKAAVDLKTKLNNQQAAVNKAASEHDKFAQKLADVESGAAGAADDVKKAGDAAKQAGDDARDAGEGWTIFKDVVADLVSNAISGLVDSIMGAAEATREYRRDLAQMAQNAADSGADMEIMKTTLEDVASITGEADAAMEGLNMLMASGLDTDGIVLASEALSGAATKFDGVKFEGIAEGLQETLAVGEAVGPFAEVIERTGGNLETFNAGLAACTTQAEKQQYVLDWLANSGLADVHDAYVQNNADLVEAEKAQFRLNDAMASVGAATEPIQTALANIGATILESLAPVIEDTITWVLDNLPTIAPIVTGIATALGVLAAALAIQGLISGVTKAFALLNTTLLANPVVLIVAAIAGLVAAFVALWNKSEAFRDFWKGMWDGIVKAFNSIVDWFKKAAGNIGKFFSDAWQGIQKAWSNAKSWASEKWQSISDTFKNAGNWFKEKFSGAWSNVKNAWANSKSWASEKWQSISGAFKNAGSWFSDKFSSAWSSVKGAFSSWGSFFTGLWDKAKSAFANSGGDMKAVGRAVVQGIWDGISGAYTWIRDKISGWVGNVTSFIKKLFGIHSPSTVMRDEVGKMLGLGMAEGIENSLSTVKGAMRDLSDAAMNGIPSSGKTGNGNAIGGKTIIFNQTNNSPKALSRREVYRQTHNALAYAGGM